MNNLQHEQLEYVKPMDFIVQQFLLHGLCFVVWLVGLGFLLFHRYLRPYRFLAFGYLLVFAFLLIMNGKAYYLLAAYPMLFAAGGYAIAYTIKNYAVRTMATLLLIIPNLILLPIVMPILTLQQSLSFFKYYHEHLPFMDFAVTWEDQKLHKTTQDYADMLGWQEMVAKVAKTYYSLTPEQQKHTIIFADNYGEAGALHVYRKQYNLPEVVCLNSSFALWAPENIKCDYFIYVSDDNDVSDLKPVVESYQRTGLVQNKLAREYGTGIFLLKHPKPGLYEGYRRHLREGRLEVAGSKAE